MGRLQRTGKRWQQLAVDLLEGRKGARGTRGGDRGLGLKVSVLVELPPQLPAGLLASRRRRQGSRGTRRLRVGRSRAHARPGSDRATPTTGGCGTSRSPRQHRSTDPDAYPRVHRNRCTVAATMSFEGRSQNTDRDRHDRSTNPNRATNHEWRRQAPKPETKNSPRRDSTLKQVSAYRFSRSPPPLIPQHTPRGIASSFRGRGSPRCSPDSCRACHLLRYRAADWHARQETNLRPTA